MMKKTNFKTGLGFAWILAGTLAAPVAHAQLGSPVDALDANLVGLGVVSVPDYSGSSNQTTAAAPIVRYQFKDSERYFLWLGPTMQVNLINMTTWRAGPMINYRPKRGSDVEDEVVKQMDQIDSVVEGGAFLQYNLKLSSQKMHQIVFATDIAGSSNGTVGHLRMMYWQPFSQTLIGNIGVGMTYGNDKFVRTYYGVTSSHDIALFPSLNGQASNPGAGVTGVNIPFGLTMAVSKQWLVSVGGRYEKLQGDAKDSPIVSQRGDSNQWLYGAAVSYLF
jgi:outer membrane scaffolding protein for murein synthesis (MipA/OmpV family)